MSVKPVRADTDGLAQGAALVGARVVVIGTGNFVHLLVGMPDRLEQPAGVAGRARVIGQVADHRRGHRHRFRSEDQRGESRSETVERRLHAGKGLDRCF